MSVQDEIRSALRDLGAALAGASDGAEGLDGEIGAWVDVLKKRAKARKKDFGHLSARLGEMAEQMGEDGSRAAPR